MKIHLTTIKYLGIIINLAYKTKLSDLNTLKQNKQQLIEEYDQIEKNENAEKAFDELYSKKVELTKVKDFHEKKLKDLEKTINELNNSIQQNQLIISPKSNSIIHRIQFFLQRIRNNKIITYAKKNIEQNSVELQKIEEIKKNCEKDILEDEKNILKIEMKFKEITGLKMELDEYKEYKEKQDIKSDYTSKKLDIKLKIDKLSYQIKSKENELNELLNTNLVTMDNQKQESIDENEI